MTLGKFNDSDVGFYYASLNKPEIKARFFPFQPDYSKTPYFKKLKLRVNSDIRNAKFNIRLYSVGENGEPKNPLYEKKIIGTVKKGTKNIEIDLSALEITFPENGLFVSYEWLIIPDNEIRTTYLSNDSNKEIEKTCMN